MAADLTNALTWTRTKNVPWTHRLSGWNCRPHWGIRPLYVGDCEKLHGRRRAGTRWVDLMAEGFEEQTFDKCDAAQKIFANYELDVFVEVHMDGLHGTGPRLALDLVQTNPSQKIRFNIWTVNEVGMRYEHLKRERVLHKDKTQTTPNPKIPESSLAQHEAGELQTSTDAECSWVRQAQT